MRAGALDLIWLLRFAGGSLLCLLSLSNCAWMPGASLASGERLNGRQPCKHSPNLREPYKLTPVWFKEGPKDNSVLRCLPINRAIG